MHNMMLKPCFCVWVWQTGDMTKMNKDGAGMESATWGAPRTNAPQGDVLLTFKSAEQTVK